MENRPVVEGSREVKIDSKSIMKFLVPSAIGVFLFIFPIIYKGAMTTPIGIISEWLAAAIKPVASMIIVSVIVISAIVSTITTLTKPKKILDSSLLSKLFVTSNFYLVFRIIGAIIAVLVYTKTGSEFIYSPDTGGTMMSLLATLIAWFFAASYLITLLMDYGAMDYTGTMVRGLVRPLFRLPGRSAIDLVTSWIGNCNVGVVLTSMQYESGYYTAREAAIISTCFSAVSLPFCLVIAAMLKVDTYFIPFYIILTITGILSVSIMSRIWPLSKFPDTYYEKVGKQINEEEPTGIKRSQWALQLAVQKAEKANSLSQVLYKGTEMFLGIIFALTPCVMSFGTIALIVATYTPVFNWISLPFGYYLQFMGLEDAFAAAPATIVGFADMFIPAILLANVASVKTRFIIGILSLVQIIYMTEVGTIIITSKIPVKLKDLAIIFLEKTIISIPIIVILTNLSGLF
ncbi:MAG: hypothetical protein APF77_13250 [Clostridia bacterium BRH_c25]|nr:MAG: hypothetical protein APF77_13250 [Clostridia bacterium BRH_c25]